MKPTKNDDGPSVVFLQLWTPTPPSFKNRKRAILDERSGKMRTLTPKAIKQRMDRLENDILCALYSVCLTTGPGTPLECLKRWRTALSGLSDDSIKEIPQGSWDVQHVKAIAHEGIDLTIEIIDLIQCGSFDSTHRLNL